MIALDNTPARGDYVRYIDDLMARAARAAPAVVSSDGDMASDVDALLRERSNVASSGTGNTASEWTPTAPNARRTRPPARSSSSGFTAPAVASPAAATASAIASALMSGQVGRHAVLSTATVMGLATVVVGVMLILAGILWHPFNFAIVVGGVALIGWALRRLKADAIGRTRST